MKGAVLAGLMLMLAACSTSFSQLSARDQMLLTCDGLATTMGIVKNFILDGTIDDAATLARIRAASVVVSQAPSSEGGSDEQTSDNE